MMRSSRLLPLAIVTVSLCGCASTPLHYYTLTEPMATTDDNGTTEGYQAQVTRVIVPPQVDRAELVIREGDDEVRVLSDRLWLSSLKDEIRSALNVEVTARLSAAIQTSGHVASTYKIFVNIMRFETVPGEYVLISADSQITNVSHPTEMIHHCKTVARIPVQNSISAGVRAYQSALKELAGTIALTVVDQGQTTPRGCAVGTT